MKKIKIEWLLDSYDCEDCGYSSEEGARVYLDGEVFLELIPKAHCFGGRGWATDEVLTEIIKKLGYEIEYAQGEI